MGANRRPGKQPDSAARPPAVSSGAHPAVVAALLFVSGACALTYQLTWLRLLRLVFGHSTAATAAVLGIFMGGLGAGAVVLGRRADSHPNPLRLYAMLEVGVTLAAAATPFLIDVARALYTSTGGSAEVGMAGATALRLVLSTVVLGAATFLMGGTLSAAARAVEVGGGDRRRTATLYGCNTLGAVSGVLLSNFVLLETLGTRSTLFAAAGVNALLAGAAWLASRATRAGASSTDASAPGDDDILSRRFVLVTAAVAGCGFLLMELVWYRTLAPLLGGSTYTFGLILAMALVGVGVGGLAYAVEPPDPKRNTIARLAVVTALEALCAIVPYALGDRLALLTISLQALGVGGFGALAATWAFVAAIVVLPMAIVSGYQFPLLISLIGSRSERVGRDVGQVYGYNTLGAIAGSLAGGFGLIPGLGALGAWIAVAASFVSVALVGAAISWRRSGSSRNAALTVAVSLATLSLCFATGPTAVWRHTPIGAALVAQFGTSPNELAGFENGIRRGLYWEEDGVESAVAISDIDAFSLMMNGKSDGNAIADASTTVMAGILPALFHPQPKRALVIGLGLGTSAGWLAAVPSIERVDVVELEPAVVRAARDSAAVNFDVVTNPKVHFVIGDAREYLLTTRERYDIIVSEPSNPYRAGIASLFTVEYYDAARRALASGGVFAQWLQAYAVDQATVKTVYATIATVFDAVESWEVQLGTDVLLLARDHESPHPLPLLRERLGSEPYASALRSAWGLAGLDGLYTGFLASPAMARKIRESTPPSRLNTDDTTLIEFEFARSVGNRDNGVIRLIREAAGRDPVFAPTVEGGEVDWAAVDELRPARSMHEEKQFTAEGFRGDADATARVQARLAYAAGHLDQTWPAWDRQQQSPVHPIDVLMMADALADAGDERCMPLIDRVRPWSEGDADAILARYRERRGDLAEATTQLANSFVARRSSAWGNRALLKRSLAMAWRLSNARAESVAPLLAALREPFAAHVAEDRRVFARASIALQLGPPADCADAVAPVEPWVPFDGAFLSKRLECYERTGSPLVDRARREANQHKASATPQIFVPSGN